MVATNCLKPLRTRPRLERLEERCTPVGGITEFPVFTANSQPYGITEGPDGNLWFTENSGDRIGRITTSGTIEEFVVPSANAGPANITTGPDGNLWFTEETADRIGRVTPAGIVTEFPVPTAGAMPFGITEGPNGNLWFTEEGSDKIGEITTAGKFTEFTVPTVGAEPTNITVGPDGNLWFTELGSNKIGKITTSGSVTEYIITTANSQPFDIVTGPDGNLWFTEEAGNKVSRITTKGAILEFAIPTASSSPMGITVGSDGNLWFTEQAGDKIGRITTVGAITEFPVTSVDSGPTYITGGPDNNLWFTEESSDRIGQLMLTTSTSPPPATSPPPGTSPPPSSGSGSSTSTTTPSVPVSAFPTTSTSDEIGYEQAAANGSGTVYLDSNGDGLIDTGDATFTFGLATDTFFVGDWADSGFDSIGVARQTSTGVLQWTLDTNDDNVFDSGDSVYSFGLNTDTPVVGDWDGDGKTEIGVVRETSSGTLQWTLDTSGTGVYTPSDAVFYFGQNGDIPIVGDWNGSGKTEIGVVRETSSGVLQWTLDTSGTGVYSSSDAVYSFGLNGDTPVIGDWNGAGKDEIAVQRAQANGTALWSLDANGDGIFDTGDNVFAFGESTSHFLVGKWQPPQALLSGDGVLNAPVQALQPDAIFTAEINQAISAWEQAGITQQQVARLESVNYSIGTLNGGLLGETVGNNIVIDATAQGNGWSESAAPQPGQMDLFTALEHEMGHILGLPDQTTQPGDLMYDSLLPGVRKTPSAQDVDAMFAGMSH